MLYLWLPLIGFVAAGFSTVAGFGAGIILITFASMVMDIKLVVPLSTLFFLGLSATQMVVFRKGIDWRSVRLYCGGALPGILLGMLLFDTLPSEVLKRLIAVVVLGYCANSILRLVPEGSPGSRITLAISAVTGAIDAVTASGGTIQAPLFLARGLRKEAFVASFAATSVLLNPLKMVIYYAMGYFQLASLGLSALLIAAGFAGVLCGRMILRHMSSESFRYLAVGFLMLLGIKLLLWG